MPNLSFILNLLSDITGAVLIVLCTFGRCKVKEFIKRTLIYFLFSFSFCGIMICIYQAFRPNGMAIYNDVVYFNISPIVLIILTLISYYIMYIIKRVTQGINVGEVCNIEIVVNNSKYMFKAKIDTGCNLKEPFSSEYVIVTEKSLLAGFSIDENHFRVIPFESLGGNGIIKGFKPEKIIIDGVEKENHIYIGICENVLNGDIRALIPAQLVC